MKLRQVFFTLLFLFMTSQFCLGQEKPKAVLVNEFGKVCSEELMALYDGFFVELQNYPTTTGYIIFYGDNSAEGRNLKFINYLNKFYPNARGFDKTRLSLIRGKNQNQMKIQFWVAPAGANPPIPKANFVEEKITSTKLFDKNWADFNKESDKLDIYSNGFFELGCEFSPNRNAFAKVLLSNRELTGYLIIYTKFGKGKTYANKISTFALKELIKDFKIPQNRIKAIYGGQREEPQIEFWLVPKDDKLPAPTPNKKPKVKN